MKSASGYADTLLTGRWAVRDTRPCEAVTARICGPTGLSMSNRLGYFANGLAVTRIREHAFFKNTGCRAEDRVLTYRLTQSISLLSADTLIADQTPSANASGRIAVRRGVIGSTHIESNAGNDPLALDDASDKVLGPLFSGCPALRPAMLATKRMDRTCAQPTVQMRIEADAAGATLLTDEYENCQPGLAMPLARYEESWTGDHRFGLIKQP